MIYLSNGDTPDIQGQKLTSRDWSEIKALNKIRPFLEDAHDLRAAILRQIICGSGDLAEHDLIGRKLGAKNKPPPTWQEIKAKMGPSIAGSQ